MLQAMEDNEQKKCKNEEEKKRKKQRGLPPSKSRA
jgi:hypothetical protein